MIIGYGKIRFTWVDAVAIATLCMTFAVSSAQGQTIQSDDFHSATLKPAWTFVDPVGDATLVLSGTNALIRVPDHIEHALWTDCNCAPRLLQAIANTDFEIEAKFDSAPSLRSQMQGFIVNEDADTYLRFDVNYDGTTARIFAGYVNGVNPPSEKINITLPSIPPCLRVKRTGSDWQYLYSTDGSTWTTAGTFTRAMTVTQVGLFAANSNPAEYSTPAFVANIDYFFNTASRIAPEDGGNPTAPTLPVVDVWYGDSQSFGQIGVPQQWVNILGTVWDTDNIVSLWYQVNGGPSMPLTIGPDGLRLVGKGDFNAEIDYADLNPGTNLVVISAVDNLAEQTNHVVTIHYTDGVKWELPYTASFSTAGAVSDVAQVIDGRWFLTGSGVRVDSSAVGFDRYITLGDRTWRPNYEVTAPLTIHDNIGPDFGVGVTLGWQGHNATGQPRIGKPYMASARIVDFPASPKLILKDNTAVRAQKAVTIQAGVRYIMKVRSQAVGVGAAHVEVKLWQDGAPEPGGWDLTYDFAARSGSVVLLADYAEATFGDVTVEPLSPLGLQSDDFSSAELDPAVWQFIDPLGDATLKLSGTNAVVYVPGGIKHTYSSLGNFTPRIMQDAPNTDFEVEACFASKGNYTYQGQGILVQQDDDTYLRFEIIYTAGDDQVFCGYFDAGVLTPKRFVTVPVPPSYLRVKRTGDLWTFDYSIDRIVWTRAIVFTQAMTVTQTGVAFNNTGGGAAYYATPAFVGNVDYFFNTGAPIDPEDGGAPTAPTPPVVDVWYGNTQNFGQLGVPQEWINIVGNVWDTDGVTSLSYSLNGGPSYPLNMGPDGFRLVGVGDFNAEIDHHSFLPGPNQVVITALDPLGEQTDQVVTINYTDGISWEIPYFAGWASAAKVTDVAYVADGRWILTADGVRTAPNGKGYDRLLVVGQEDWVTDYEVLIPMTIHEAELGGRTGVGIALGWAGHVPPPLPASQIAQPMVDVRYQTIAWIRDWSTNAKLQIRDDDAVRGELAMSIQPDVCYLLRARSQTTAPGVSRVDVKLWQNGTPEPANWMLSDNFTSYRGSVAIIGHSADVTFGNTVIMPLQSFPLHNLTTSVLEGGSIARTPDYAAYYDSSSVMLTAIPDEGWLFDYWSGGITGSANPATVKMVANTTVQANFRRKEFTLTIWVAGHGSVAVEPEATTYLYGDKVVITATPDPGHYFYGWYGDNSGNENPDTVTVTGEMKITGMFFGEITGIDTPPALDALTVLQNTPNPFTRETYFHVGLPEASDVEISIYDVAGRRVYAAMISGANAGWNRFLFSGNDEDGRPLASGVYFYRVRTRAESVTHRMVVIR